MSSQSRSRRSLCSFPLFIQLIFAPSPLPNSWLIGSYHFHPDASFSAEKLLAEPNGMTPPRCLGTTRDQIICISFVLARRASSLCVVEQLYANIEQVRWRSLPKCSQDHPKTIIWIHFMFFFRFSKHPWRYHTISFLRLLLLTVLYCINSILFYLTAKQQWPILFILHSVSRPLLLFLGMAAKSN